MKKLIFIFLYISLILYLTGCTSSKKKKIFKRLPSTLTNINFNNSLSLNNSIDKLSFEYLYNGAGLAVGDVNNDGLPDIYFAGNMASSELYLNQGDLKFNEVTKNAGVTTDRWCTGVSIIDINDDGLKDIYVCVAGYDTICNTRENICFINEGIDEHGIPHFKDLAKEMGLNDDGYSTMGVFFDYDKDLDLDLFLLTNAMDGIRRSMIRPIAKDGKGSSTDRLYKNDGSNRFHDVSYDAGIVNEGYGLGVGIADINRDGWLDIYCANDFVSNDLLYINNQDGTFTESSSTYFKHFSHNGMGMDLGDYNNDGLIDVMVLDMLPPDNKRQKLMIESNAITFKESTEKSFHPQFLRNTLQLNRGKFKDGPSQFSEIGYLAGVYQTDWSWAPLLVDFDNDGWKDLLITNGFRKDVTNMDYFRRISQISRFGTREANRIALEAELENLPEVKLTNYIYQNKGDLTFEDRSDAWGFSHQTFTNGTAFADFDMDGDLDLVFNNIDQEVTFYENKIIHGQGKISNHYLKMLFDASVKEVDKIGLKVWLFQSKNCQLIEYSPFRGYKSTMSEEIHFGLGKEIMIDSLWFAWSDGGLNRLLQIRGDTVLIITKELALPYSPGFIADLEEAHQLVEFHENSKLLDLNFMHESALASDFQITPTLLHSLSGYGPSISVGDINGDGFDDIFMGGDAEQKPIFLLQDERATFSQEMFLKDSVFHDTGSLLFDVDNDGDLDLYVVSGGYRWPRNHENYQDRLYMNDGLGKFSMAKGCLPQITSSGSCVIGADYDKDGDLDLFVGGRVVGQSYPLIPESYLLQNTGGKFIDRSELLGEKGGKLGMVTSGLWTDVNNDQQIDLVIVGEWMEVMILINEEGRFIERSEYYGTEALFGWWNSINGSDLDNDGDIDYVLGNYGLNSFYKASKDKPLEIFASDFDLNGSIDPVITHYIGEKSYLVHPLGVLSRQIPAMEKRFNTYSQYGDTEFKYSFTRDELQNATHLRSNIMSSIVLENLEGKTFKIHVLPVDVQFAPVYGILLQDVNADGYEDILLVGNSMGEETIFGYYDASYGNVLLNMGHFTWESLEPAITNFVADGDKKAFAKIKLADGKSAFIISENDGYLQSYEHPSSSEFITISLQQDDWHIKYTLEGKLVKEESYHGHGFLSSSSRTIDIPKIVNQIIVYKYNGNSRIIHLNELARY